MPRTDQQTAWGELGRTCRRGCVIIQCFFLHRQSSAALLHSDISREKVVQSNHVGGFFFSHWCSTLFLFDRVRSLICILHECLSLSDYFDMFHKTIKKRFQARTSECPRSYFEILDIAEREDSPPPPEIPLSRPKQLLVLLLNLPPPRVKLSRWCFLKDSLIQRIQTLDSAQRFSF